MDSHDFVRTVNDHGKTYHVTRLFSSGVGTQYACSYIEDSREKTLLLTDDFVERNSVYRDLFMKCAQMFDDSFTFAKYTGSSSFTDTH